MLKRRASQLGLLTAALCLSGCQQTPVTAPTPSVQTPQNIRVIGKGSVHTEPSLQAQQLTDEVTYTSAPANIVPITVNGTVYGRYLTQEITVTNKGTRTLQNLELVGVNTGSNPGGTALSNISTSAGSQNDAATARQFIPSQTPDPAIPGMTDGSKSSFQLLTPKEADEIETQGKAAGLLSPNADVLEYAFHSLKQSDTPTTVQRLAPGESAKVYLAFTLPDNFVKADYNFIAAELPQTRVSKARNEDIYTAFGRAYQQGPVALAAEDTSPMAPYASFLTLISTPNPKFWTLDTAGSEDAELPTPLHVEISDPPIIARVGETVTFDASLSSGPDGTQALWMFPSSTGVQTIAKPLDDTLYVPFTFSEAGPQTIMLAITSPDGQTQQKSYIVTVLPEDDKLAVVPQEARTGESVTLAVPPLPQSSTLQTTWTVDGQTYTGHTVQQQFQTAGFHDIKVLIRDPNGTPDEDGDLPIVYQDSYHINVHGQRFKPSITYTDGTWQSLVNGVVDFTMPGASEAASRGDTFLWDFGDGTTSQQPNPVHTYTRYGRFAVTVTVTHPDGTQDQDANVIIYNNPNLAISSLRSHRLNSQSLQSQAVTGLSGTIESPFLVPSTNSNTKMLQYVQGFENFQNVQVTRDGQAIAEGQGWQKSNCSSQTYDGGITQNFCSSLDFENFPLSTGQSGLHSQTTTLTTVQTSPTFAQKQTYNLTTNTVSYAGLRVPKVILNYLPSAQLEDQQAGTQTFSYDEGGQQQMVSMVNIADSTNDAYTIDIPVFMVNEQGQVMPEANGFTQITAPGYSLYLDKNVIVHGKGTLKVTVTRTQLEDPNFSLDLSQLNVSANMINLSSSNIFKDSQNNLSEMTGQVTLPTSSQTPQTTLSGTTLTGQSLQAQQLQALGILDLFKTFQMPLPKDFKNRLGKVWAGQTQTMRKAINKALADYDGSVVSIAVSFVPVMGDSIDLLIQGYSYATTRKVDPVATTLATLGLAMDLGTGVADVTTPLKAVYKGSKGSGREVIKAMVEDFRKLPPQTSTATAFNRMKATGALFWELKADLHAGIPALDQALKLSYQAKGNWLTALDALSTSYTNLKPAFNPYMSGMGKIKTAKYGIFGHSAGEAIAKCGDECVIMAGDISDYISSNLNKSNIDSIRFIESKITAPVFKDINPSYKIPDINSSLQCIVEFSKNKLSSLARKSSIPRGQKCPLTIVKDTAGRVTSLNASVDAIHLNGGTNPTKAAREYTKKYGSSLASTPDDAGHILAYILGGPGGLSADNIVPMLYSMNRGALSSFEKELKDLVLGGSNLTIKVDLQYLEPAFPMRPSKIIYNVIETKANGTSRSLTRTFLNPTK